MRRNFNKKNEKPSGKSAFREGHGAKKAPAGRNPFQDEAGKPREVRNPFRNMERMEDDLDEFRREDGEERIFSRNPERKPAVGPRKKTLGGKRDGRSAVKKAEPTRPARTFGPAKKTDSMKKPPRVKKEKTPKDAAVYGDRLQKILAVAGLGSRRDCEELILAGRVMVDREVVDELGARVKPHQTIHFDGELLRRGKKLVYFALNKPTNVICTNDDPAGRRRALDFIHEDVPGLFPVGRLDLHSEGLLLVTNDGELANRLTHPRYEVPKVYQVRVSGTPTQEEIAKISRGVYLAEGLARADDVRILHTYKDGTAMLKITLREGRNREIRRILAKVGHNVLSLERVAIGPLKLGKMPVGEYRALTREEVRGLRKLVGMGE